MKIELKRESFENSPFMEKFKKRKFLLTVIILMQALIILLMLGLLVFMVKEEEADPVSTFSIPYLPSLVEKESMDWQRLLLDIVGVGLIPLMAWYNSKTSGGGWDGVSKSSWGEETLLREGGDGLWYFGPADI